MFFGERVTAFQHGNAALGNSQESREARLAHPENRLPDVTQSSHGGIIYHILSRLQAIICDSRIFEGDEVSAYDDPDRRRHVT
jgi:hypothetical protein